MVNAGHEKHNSIVIQSSSRSNGGTIDWLTTMIDINIYRWTSPLIR